MSELERYAALRWYGRHGDALHLDLAEYCCKRIAENDGINAET